MSDLKQSDLKITFYLLHKSHNPAASLSFHNDPSRISTVRSEDWRVAVRWNRATMVKHHEVVAPRRVTATSAGVPLKRSREETSSAESVSPASSCATNKHKKIKMQQWKDGAYIVMYLTLLDEVISGTKRLDGDLYSRDFWIAFTKELNERIKGSLVDHELPEFKGFSAMDVVTYGNSLRGTYHQNKTRTTNLPANFELYVKAFSKCERCPFLPMFPTREIMCGKRSSGSHSCSTTSSHKRRSSISAESSTVVERVAAQLAYLNRSGLLDEGQLIKCAEYFETAMRQKLWLDLSVDAQVSYINKLYPPGVYP